jgi:hypothetical protein
VGDRGCGDGQQASDRGSSAPSGGQGQEKGVPAPQDLVHLRAPHANTGVTVSPPLKPLQMWLTSHKPQRRPPLCRWVYFITPWLCPIYSPHPPTGSCPLRASHLHRRYIPEDGSFGGKHCIQARRGFHSLCNGFLLVCARETPAFGNVICRRLFDRLDYGGSCHLSGIRVYVHLMSAWVSFLEDGG